MDRRLARTRKLLSLAAVGLLVVVVAGAATFAIRQGLAEQSAVVQIGSTSGLVGENVTTRVSILNLESPGLGAFSIDVHYDPAVVSPVSPCDTNPDNVSNLVVLCNVAYDTITVRVGGFQPYPDGVTGDVALADLTFRILSEATSDLTLDVAELYDTSATPIDYVVTNGSITGGVPAESTPSATPSAAAPTVTPTPRPGARLELDMDVTNGSGPCNPVDSSVEHHTGDRYAVAVCLTNASARPAVFNFGLVYDHALNQCVPTGCSPTDTRCLDSNPDANAGSTTFSNPGLGLSGQNDWGWDCTMGGILGPQCDSLIDEGQGPYTFMTCTDVDIAPTLPVGPGVSAPLAVVNFMAAMSGTDEITFGPSAVYDLDSMAIVDCEVSGSCFGGTDAKGGEPVTPLPTLTATGTPSTNTPTPTNTRTRTPTPIPPTATRTSTPLPPTATYTPTPEPTAHGVGGKVLLPPAAIADDAGTTSGGSDHAMTMLAIVASGIVVGSAGWTMARRRARR